MHADLCIVRARWEGRSGNGGVRGGERGEWSWGLGPVKYDES